MSDHERMVAAYKEALAWASTDENDNDFMSYEFSPIANSQCHIDCQNFALAFHDLIDDFDAAQIGHDLFLTRNGHGTGFWDRPEIYGTELAEMLSRAAAALGECYPYIGDDGLIYLD